MVERTKKIPFRSVIFDTDVLIWYFRAHKGARDIVRNIPKEHRWVSALNVMELFQGCCSREELRNIQAFFAENFSRIIHTSEIISENALHLVDKYALSHGLRLVDAMIAATALLHRALLITANARHFQFIDGLEVKVFQP